MIFANVNPYVVEFLAILIRFSELCWHSLQDAHQCMCLLVLVGNRGSNDCTPAWMEQCNIFVLVQFWVCHFPFPCSVLLRIIFSLHAIQKHPDDLAKAAELAVSSLQVCLLLICDLYHVCMLSLVHERVPFEILAISRVNCGWVILLMFGLL